MATDGGPEIADKELQPLLEELRKLDDDAPKGGPNAPSAAVVRYNLARADVLEKIVQQVAGDDFALMLAETAAEYPYAPEMAPPEGWLRMGLGQADVPGWGVGPMSSRLPGQEFGWAEVRLRRRPEPREQQDWRQRWNPYSQCSWPPAARDPRGLRPSAASGRS